MADTFGMETVEQLLHKVEAKGKSGDTCVVCGKVSIHVLRLNFM